jgi:hypothetical protein
VFLLASTAPHLVHHVMEAAHHEPVACQLYTVGVSIQWLALVVLPALVVWLAPHLIRRRHECHHDVRVRPHLRCRAPPLPLA